jgi:hypothetical protein
MARTATPTFTLGGVSAWIVSVEESWDEDGPAAEVVYRTYYNDRWTFVRELAGKVTSSGSPATGQISRLIPHAYPAPVAFDRKLYAQPSIKIKPDNGLAIRDDGAGWCNYGKTIAGVDHPGTALITVPYKTLKWDVEGSNSVYVTEDLEGAAQMITLPGSPFRFASDSKPINQDVGMLMPQISLSRSYAQVPYIDDRIWSLIGTVNAATFRGQAVGTFLFEAVRTHQESFALGGTNYGIDISMLFRPISWNKVFRSDNATWDTVTPVIYQPGDYSVFDSWAA